MRTDTIESILTYYKALASFYGQGGAIQLPKDFHELVAEIELCTKQDSSGIVNSLADFMINSACGVDYYIETPNKSVTLKLNTWLETLNKDLNHTKVEAGIQALARQYFTERWTKSSLLLNRSIFGYDKSIELVVPTMSYFVKGGRVIIEEDTENPKIGAEKYILKINDKEKIILPSQKSELNYIQCPYSRWTDRYPNPFYNERGILHSLKLFNLLTSKSEKIIASAQELLEFIKKGNDRLAVDSKISYTPEVLKDAQQQFNEYKEKTKDNTQSTPAFVNYDTQFEQLIPDYNKAINEGIYAPIERRILQGFGMVDILDGTSNSRKESILNPKPMAEEIKAGIKDFKAMIKKMLRDIVLLNQDKNSLNIDKIEVRSSSLSPFISKDEKEQVRRLYQYGLVSKQTAVEFCGGAYLEYSTEVRRRTDELERGEEVLMYAQVIQNNEKDVSDTEVTRGSKPTPDKEVPESKKGVDAQDYTASSIEEICQDLELSVTELAKVLETSPYSKPADLPSKVKNKMAVGLQRIFIRVFNQALKRHGNETTAFKIAWSVISKNAHKNKEGKWVRNKPQTKREMSGQENN